MRSLAFALAFALLVAPVATSSAQQSDVSCPHRAGFIDGPYVATAKTARAIATALAQQMQAPDRQAQYDLNIQDGGDHWVAFQSVRGYPRREGDALVVMAGGGGLQMRISKCDGTISEVHWLR